MDRAEMFKKAKEAADAEAENRKNGNFTPHEYEKIPFEGLETNKLKVFRFVGNPYTVREENWHPKMVLSSKIVGDNKKQFVCRWSEDRDWFLWRVYNKITAYDWDENFVNPDGSKGRKVYKLAKTNPEILDRVLHNNKKAYVMPDGRKIEDSGWKPNRSVYMNCICKDDYDWHKENKSYKLIAKKIGTSEDAEGNVSEFPEPGIPVSCYEYIIKAVVEENGAWEDFDIAIKKEEKEPWYSAYSFMDERKIKDQLSVAMNGDPMTEEELSWDKIDIDKITQVTSYRKIHNRLGKFIKHVDEILNTDFTSELEELVAEEKAKWKEDHKDSSDENEKTEEPKAEEKKTRLRKPAESNESSSSENVYDKMRKLGWVKADQLEKDMKDMGVELTVDFGESEKTTKLHFVCDGEEISQDDLIPCCDCYLPGPEIIDYCPACGAVFKS